MHVLPKVKLRCSNALMKLAQLNDSWKRDFVKPVIFYFAWKHVGHSFWTSKQAVKVEGHRKAQVLGCRPNWGMAGFPCWIKSNSTIKFKCLFNCWTLSRILTMCRRMLLQEVAAKVRFVTFLKLWTFRQYIQNFKLQYRNTNLASRIE